jgi:glutathione S-transferase
MALTLLIGNKNYSSWSLRPWLAMRATGIAFEEVLVPLGADDFKERVSRFSPTGKVPALIDGGQHIWESIAILEHLAEKFPHAGLWPSDAPARTHGRAIAAEMHAGFNALRSHCPMNMRRPARKRELPMEVQANVMRIDALWTECRARYGHEGPFLFGRFCAADAMYAPVVSRFMTYGIEVGAASRAYMAAITALPAYVEWKAAGITEPWVLPEDEVDWPTVLRA